MPIEIRELIIKASIEGNDTQTTGASSSSGSKKQIEIQVIAEKVLEIIKSKSER